MGSEILTTDTLRSRATLQTLMNESTKFSNRADQRLKYFPTTDVVKGFAKIKTWSLCLNNRQYSQIGFYHDFAQINSIAQSAIKSQQSTSTQLNSCYVPKFIDYFLKHHSPYICTISPYLKKLRRDKFIKHSSNATVEGSFAQTKTRLRNDINLHEKDRVDRIFNLESERKYVDGVIKLIQFPNNDDHDQSYALGAEIAKKVDATDHEEDTLTPIELSLTETKFKKKVKTSRTTKQGLSNAIVMKKQTPVLPILQNGLVSDPLFYTHSAHYGQYYVAQHPSSFLFTEDYLSLLTERQQVISSVIQYLLELYIANSSKRDEIFFVPFEYSNKIFNDEIPDYSYVYVPSNAKTIVFHVIIKLSSNQNHHVLIIADLETKEFFYCDSLKCTLAEEKTKSIEMFRLFKKFVAAKGLNRKEFKCLLMPHNYQTDGYSCGLFVILHAKAYITTGNFIYEEFSELETRMALAQTVLDGSQSLSSSCIKCLGEKKGTVYYECGKCNRFVHCDCIQYGFEAEYKACYSKVCPLCANYFRTFQ